MSLSLREVERAIEQFGPDEQRRLLAALPHLLKISVIDLAHLKVAEPSFQFWENPDDTIYDTL